MKKTKRPLPKKAPAKKTPPAKSAKAAPKKVVKAVKAPQPPKAVKAPKAPKAPKVPKAPKAPPTGKKPRAGAPIAAWDDDPESGLKVDKRPAPTLSLIPLPMEISGPAPKAAIYPTGTANFRYWTGADALRRAKEYWKTHLPDGGAWHDGVTLTVHLDAGEDLNAYYDRKSLSFFHGNVKGKAIYTGESADIVCHEFGHAVLDSLRPDLWDASLDEVAAFHESFADISAILTALQLPSVRAAVLKETGGHIWQNTLLSRIAEQFGKAIHAINPHSAPADCLRNAVNSFFYADPMHLPPSAPDSSLSSEPHSFSRVFTGGFFEAMSGMLKTISAKPNDADLQTLAHDAGALLTKAVRAAALSAAFYSEIAAQIIWADTALFEGKYDDALRSAFVRRGLLSLEAARSLKAEAARAVVAKPTPGDEMPRGRDMIMRASAFGLTEGAVVVRTASFSRRGLIAPAAADTGSTPVPGVEQATQSFLETLFRRGRVDFSQIKPGVSSVGHTTVRRKTHYLVEHNGQFHLHRRCFDDGFEDWN